MIRCFSRESPSPTYQVEMSKEDTKKGTSVKEEPLVRASTAGPFCLARLTNWERTNEPLGDSNIKASMLYLCPNKPMKDLPICSKCLERPDSSKYQSRMIHGLLTEAPPPTSHIYGSKWYWKQVEKHGLPSKLWLELAKEAQRRGEERVSEAKGAEAAWRIEDEWKDAQSESEENGEMPPKKKQEVQKTTLLTNFPVITKHYQESSKNPQQVQTDVLKIQKVKQGSGEEVWETEDGMKFKVDERGEIGELIIE